MLYYLTELYDDHPKLNARRKADHVVLQLIVAWEAENAINEIMNFEDNGSGRKLQVR